MPPYTAPLRVGVLVLVLQVGLVDVRVRVRLAVVAVLMVMLDVLVSMLGMRVAVAVIAVVIVVVGVRCLVGVFVSHGDSLSSLDVSAATGKSRLPPGSARRCLIWRNASSRTLARCVSWTA